MIREAIGPRVTEYVKDVFAVEKFEVSSGYLEQIRISANKLDSASDLFEASVFRLDAGVTITDFSPILLRRFGAAMQRQGLAKRTIRNNLKNIVAIWRFAYRRGDVMLPVALDDIPKVLVEKSMPKAWSVEEVSRICEACMRAPTLRGWGPLHWLALVLLCYDTSLRIGTVRKLTLAALSRGGVYAPANTQKNREETFHELHPETLEALRRMKRLDQCRLLPYPFAEGTLWRQFKRLILIPAGLPCTRNDLFHKLRRTSYTYVSAILGREEATRHAHHKSDLSSSYEDPVLKRLIQGKPGAIDVLPRPRWDSNADRKAISGRPGALQTE